MHAESADRSARPQPGSAEASADDSMEDAPQSATPPSTTVEGLRNVSGLAQQLLQLSSVKMSAVDAPRQAATAWSVLFASVLQKSMFSNVLLARPTPPAAEGAAGSSSSGYEIWHVSRGLQELLGVPASSLLARPRRCCVRRPMRLRLCLSNRRCVAPPSLATGRVGGRRIEKLGCGGWGVGVEVGWGEGGGG